MKYKYFYTGTTKMMVEGQTVKKPGDTVELSVNTFRHIWFRPEKESLFNINTLKEKGKGKSILLIGRGDSCLNKDLLKDIKFDMSAQVNVNRTKMKTDFLIYLEVAMVDWIHKNIDSLDKDMKIIGHQLLVSNRTDYFYSHEHVKEGHGVGFYALQLLDKVLNFDKIYLIGFDYDDDSRNWKPLIEDFNTVEWGKVINLNPKSKLTLKGEKKNVNKN